MEMISCNFEELKGKIITSCKNVDNNEIIFACSDGTAYKLHHFQDCCEDVLVEDICGDLDDIIGNPILEAEEATNENEDEHCHYTWTFYKLSTIKGNIVIRWYGTSNGYYSETVSFGRIEKE